MISVRNLSKKYMISRKGQPVTFREMMTDSVRGLFQKNQISDQHDFWALSNISCEIAQGDRVAIIGRNGAGKSTFLKILSRITYPTTGNITIQGRVASLLEVGTGFHPELTGRENIYLNGAIMGMSRAEIKGHFDSIIAFSEIEQFLDTPVKRYSSGMYVKLAFAVAAHLEAEILIIDEVLAVGDVRFQKKCLGKIDEVSKKGRTILFVSHNLSTVSSLCNQGIFLEKGSPVVHGSLDQCLSEYLKDPKQRKSSLWEGKAGNHFFYVTRLSLESQQAYSHTFSKKDKGIVTLEMVAAVDMKDMLMIFNIFTLQGVLLMQRRVAPKEAQQFIFDLKKGTYQIQLEVDFSLFAEGSYVLEVDAGVHNIGRIVDHVSIQFEVIDTKKKFGDSSHVISPEWSWNFIESLSS